MESNRRYSVNVSRALDCLGKSQDMVKFRLECYKQGAKLRADICNDSNECIIAGSKGEGLTAPFESDYDVMTIVNDVICADDTSTIRHIMGVTLFETDRKYTSPGYTKLRLDRLEERTILKIQNLITYSLIKEKSGQLYLSSHFFFEMTKMDLGNLSLDRSGPSDPYSLPNLCISLDHINAFQCFCPQITRSFITRHRDYGWPSNEQLAKIATLDGHVVPVGYKGSDTACLEWRICYTKAERFLICSLNDTQRKLYILLKMVAKTYLNSTSKEITSYVLKNIVLWLAECCDSEMFNEELLADRLIQALRFLLKCIINNNLPSYMIPERNLFSEKLDLVQRQKLVILLTGLMHEGGRLLMGCERLCGTMIVLYKEPAVAEQYRCQRDMIEKLMLWQKLKVGEIYLYCDADIRQTLMLLSTGADSSVLIKSYVIIGFLLYQDTVSLLLQGHDLDLTSIKDTYFQRLKQWLS